MSIPVQSGRGMRAVAGVACFGALLLSGCATTSGPTSASGKRIPPKVLEAAEQRVASESIPAELRSYYLAKYAEGRENETLHAVRGGLEALRTGQHDAAKQLFDEAIRDVESLQAGARQAERTQGKFVREQEKWFKGESHERAALYVYRGLLYLIDHDFGNAAAAFKRAEIQDITGDETKDFAGDWYSAEWGLAFASLKAGFPRDAESALQRAAAFSTKQGNVPAPRATDNVVVVVEVGRGPDKYRSGQYGEQLRFREYPPRVQRVELVIDGNVVAQSDPAEDLYVQATTRGKRQVDFILQGKAAFKEGTGTAAAVFGGGAIIAAHHDSSGIATGVLGGLAVLSAIASSATTPEADIREWNNLPHSIYLIGLQAKPGPIHLTVRGLGSGENVVGTVAIDLQIDATDPARVVMVRL